MWSAASAPAGPRGPLVTFGDLVGDLTAEETREFVDRGDFDDREGGVQERGKLRRRRRRSQQQQEQPRGEGGDVVTGSSAPSLLPRPASPPLALPASPHAARASHVTRHMLLSSFEVLLSCLLFSLLSCLLSCLLTCLPSVYHASLISLVCLHWAAPAHLENGNLLSFLFLLFASFVCFVCLFSFLFLSCALFLHPSFPSPWCLPCTAPTPPLQASLDDFRSSLSEPGHAWTRFTAQVSQPRPHCDMPCRAVPCPALPWRAVPRRAVPCLAML
ncbi:unnamed protein product [Closterium sp. NIES-54]